MSNLKNKDSKQAAKPPPSCRILVVDDDYYFRLALEKSLTQNKHQPTCAENAKHAQQLLLLNKFDLILSDIKMPEMSGLELLAWTKANHPIPFVLMTGFADILETQEAAKLGAHAFLAKPFKLEELLKVIDSSFLKEDEKETETEEEEKYCKIGMDDFVTGKDMKFDIFIRLSEGKYVKVSHGGENIPLDRIQAYKKKGIRFLYMKKEDFHKYLNFSLVLAQAVTNSEKIAHVKKVRFLKHATDVALENLYTNEVNRDDFLQAGALVENAVSLFIDSPDAASLLDSLASHSDFLYAHSLGVSLYSTLIGKALGWHSPTTVFKLSMGGLLHDIGKKEIDLAILNKKRVELTPSDIATLETHPTRGAEILARLQCVATDILQIVHEHHENCLGFGYPSHLMRSKIHPMARVISVANAFCNFAIKNPDSPGMKPAAAITNMLALNPEYYDETCIQALFKVFKLSEKDFALPGRGSKHKKAS